MKLEKMFSRKIFDKIRLHQMKFPNVNNEDGFILVVTMFVLVVLTLIGLSATNLTTIELFVSGNDRVHKDTFYKADSGAEIGTRLVYDNAICVQVNGGFGASEMDGTTRIFNTKKDDGTDGVGVFKVFDLQFSDESDEIDSISDAGGERDLVYYPEATHDDTAPHTNVRTYGTTTYSPGSGLQMVSGYEGLGASSIGGGTQLDYRIWAQHKGIQNSSSLVKVGWRIGSHILNSAATEDCMEIFK